VSSVAAQQPASKPVRGGRVWLLAARPATLPAAVVPVLVGTAAALHSGVQLQVGPFVAALVAALLIQIGTNFANDVFDFRKGADTAERLGPPRVTQSGMVPPEHVLIATFVTFGLAALIGVYLVLVGGWPILVVGVLSILAGLAYTGGPWPIGYHSLGDLFVFIFFGVVAVVGSAYLQTLSITPLAVWASFPVGLLVTAILIVNNLRDIDTDRQVGKKTLAVRLGRRATRMQFANFVRLAYVVPPVLWLQGLVGPWFWMPLLSMPLAIPLIRFVEQNEGRALNEALKRTGRLHLVFGVLFAISLWLP
jgi:1,4-dihydroxy-2-naphthoate polyprenyltransferase